MKNLAHQKNSSVLLFLPLHDHLLHYTGPDYGLMKWLQIQIIDILKKKERKETVHVFEKQTLH